MLTPSTYLDVGHDSDDFVAWYMDRNEKLHILPRNLGHHYVDNDEWDPLYKFAGRLDYEKKVCSVSWNKGDNFAYKRLLRKLDQQLGKDFVIFDF